MSIMCIWFIATDYWVYKGCFNEINVSVNRVSTISSHTQSAINGLHCHILPKGTYRSTLLENKHMTCSLPHPKNERQPSMNDFWHCIMKHPAGCAVTVSHNRTIGCLSMEQWWWQLFYYVLKISVNRASTTLGLACCKMHGRWGDITTYSCYWSPC
jgi:hypothetical protein